MYYEHRNSPCPLYSYAAVYWGHHARKVSALPSEVMKFLNSKSCLNLSAQKIGFFKRKLMDSNLEFSGLQLAAYFGLENAVRILLNNEFDWPPNGNNESPLIFAAAGGHEAVVRFLIKSGVAVNTVDKSGWSPLRYAAVNRYENILKLLLDAEAHPNPKCTLGEMPLFYAVQNDYKALIDHIIDSYSVDINVRNDFGMTPLIEATKKGYGTTVKGLLERGANADRKDGKGWTPLLHATWNKQVDVVKMLLANNANPNTRDKIGRTAIFYAIVDGSIKMFEASLADERFERYIVDLYGLPPLTIAVIQKQQEIVELLLVTSSSNPDLQDHFGRTYYGGLEGIKMIMLSVFCLTMLRRDASSWVITTYP
ncbi:MAG: hypothetical protein Q9214_003126 [Letrouitia sp. 1 TL-2023]